MHERTIGTKRHKLGKIIDKVTHPGTQDLHTLSLYAAPLALGVVGGIGLFGLNYLLYREGITPPDVAIDIQSKLYTEVIASFSAFNGFYLGAMVPARYFNRRNTKDLSGLLTVTKETAHAYNDLPGVSEVVGNEQYIGVLHLVGDNGKSKKELTNSHSVRRDGFAGLYQLAQDFEADASYLQGINHVIGISPLMSERFNQLGFVTTPFSPDSRRRRDRSVNNTLETSLTIAKTVLPLTQSRMNTYQNQPSMIGIISREDMISHKDLYRRFSGIIPKEQ